MGGGRTNALKSTIDCYEALYVHKLGVYCLENVSSTNILLKDKKNCSKHLCGIRPEKCLHNY